MVPANIIGSIILHSALTASSNPIYGGKGVTEIISRRYGRVSCSGENSIGLFERRIQRLPVADWRISARSMTCGPALSSSTRSAVSGRCRSKSLPVFGSRTAGL